MTRPRAKPTKRKAPASRGNRRGYAPTKTTPDALERICAHIEQGLPMADAARIEGVLPDTLKHRRESDPSVDEQIERARSLGKQKHLQTLVYLAGLGSRTGGQQFLLERLYPKDFGPPTQRHQHSGSLADAIADVLGDAAKSKDLAED